MNSLQMIAIKRLSQSDPYNMENLDFSVDEMINYYSTISSLIPSEYDRLKSCSSNSEKRIQLIRILQERDDGWNLLLEALKRIQRSWLEKKLLETLENVKEDVKNHVLIPELNEICEGQIDDATAFLGGRPDPFIEDASNQTQEIVEQLVKYAELPKEERKFFCIMLRGPSGIGKSVRMEEVFRDLAVLERFKIIPWTHAPKNEDKNVLVNIYTALADKSDTSSSITHQINENFLLSKINIITKKSQLPYRLQSLQAVTRYVTIVVSLADRISEYVSS